MYDALMAQPIHSHTVHFNSTFVKSTEWASVRSDRFQKLSAAGSKVVWDPPPPLIGFQLHYNIMVPNYIWDTDRCTQLHLVAVHLLAGPALCIHMQTQIHPHHTHRLLGAKPYDNLPHS